MYIKTKHLLRHIGCQTFSIVAAGVFGVVAFSTQANSENSNKTGKSTDASYQQIEFKKAGIDEYDMEEIASVSQADTQDASKIVALKASKTDDSFTVAIPKDNTVIYNPSQVAAKIYGTRWVSSEYYSVKNIHTGKIVTMNAHEMLCQIVNSEIGSTWDEDAIKAQVVAAYTALRFNDSIGCIPTVGLKSGYSQKIENCVSAVEGQCIYYNGSIINAVYSASSAGASAESENVWGVSYPYLKAVKCDVDKNDPNYGVQTTFSKKQMKEFIESNTDIVLSKNVENWIKIDSVFSGKYAGNITIDGHSTAKVNGTETNLTGVILRSEIMGYEVLRSNAFEIAYEDGVFTFTTYGYGHGVGMSQWGACLYANKGYSYDQILAHYYLNTSIKVSSVSQKAVTRGKKTKQELEQEIAESEIVDNKDETSAQDRTQTADEDLSEESTQTTTTTVVTKVTTTAPQTTTASSANEESTTQSEPQEDSMEDSEVTTSQTVQDDNCDTLSD